MEKTLLLGDKAYVVALVMGDANTAELVIDGAVSNVKILERRPGYVVAKIGERVAPIYLSAPMGELRSRHVALPGSSFAISEAPEEEGVAAGAASSGSKSFDGQIRSPMPAKVVKVCVSVGQDVEASSVCAVVEAMKMEHSLSTPVAGKIKSIAVSEGSQVGLGEVVVTVELL